MSDSWPDEARGQGPARAPQHHLDAEVEAGRGALDPQAVARARKAIPSLGAQPEFSSRRL